jgi:hypothetical protein
MGKKLGLCIHLKVVRMANSQADAERSQWIVILEAASQQPPDEINQEWEWLLDQLGLAESYFLAVLEAIRQGRWRTAKKPKAYLKTVAKREAVKMGLLSDSPDILELVNSSPDGGNFSLEGALDDIAHRGQTADALRGEDGVWRRGGGCGDPYDEDNPRAGVSFHAFLLSKVPKDLKETTELSSSYNESIEEFNSSTDEFHLHPRPFVRVNWDKWAELAGFDEWDRLALTYRIAEVSRDRALAEQPNEASRKALQAAWRQFDRNGLERLQEASKIISAKNVPESQKTDT